MKVCFQTLFNNYDRLTDPLVITPGWHYIVFTDIQQNSKVWESVILPKPENPFKFCRYIWHNPDEFMRADTSLMIGAQTQINCDLDRLAEYLTGDIAVMRHFIYKDILEEVQAVLKNEQAPAKEVKQAYVEIMKTGYPLNFGLYCLGMVLRKHNDRTLKFFQTLSLMVQSGCHRDQIYFPFVWWQNREIKINVIEQNLYEIGMLNQHKHNVNK